jgi:hypothetical protein
MRPTPVTLRRVRSLIVMSVVAAAEALCQDKQNGALNQAPAFRPQRRIVVSIPDRKLALVEDGRVVKIYLTAVGAPASPSPAGTYTILQRVKNPAWYGPGTVVAAGKNNPVGTRWLGLSRKSYGIHGTNNPRSIGRRASHGCIRMRNRDIEELFELVSVGDVVELHGERDIEVTQIFAVPAAPSVQPASGQVLTASLAGGQ